MARIGLCGTHSTGKTTLAKALAEKLPQYYLDINVTRWVRSLGFPINEESNDASQEINFLKRVAHLNSFDHIIADRTIVDNIAYSTVAFERGNLSKESLVYQKMLLYKNIYKYDYLFYIPPEIPLELDGVRPVDEWYRKNIAEIVEKTLDGAHKHNPKLKLKDKVFTITGNTTQRVKKIMEIMNELRPSQKSPSKN